MSQIDGKNVLIIGGTGSLGTHLTRRLLSGKDGNPASVSIFSRDEDKQHSMRLEYPDKRLKFIIGDVRDINAVRAALHGADMVFNAAAMKHVPSCEAYPIEAVKTNVLGTINIVETIRGFNIPVETVVGVASDKGAHPCNLYGSTKFTQAAILLNANNYIPDTRFISVCYGNVLASRGSVIPVFQKQIGDGGPVTITDPFMSRFLISLDQAVDTLLEALENAQRGEVYVPIIPSAYVGDIAKVLINGNGIETRIIGKRTGEKMHEVLITEEETERVVRRGDYYVVTQHTQENPVLIKEYNSRDYLISYEELREIFIKQGFVSERVKA